MFPKIALLHLVNGEQVRLSIGTSKEIRSALDDNNQSLHDSAIHENGHTYFMWNVVKIKWLEN